MERRTVCGASQRLAGRLSAEDHHTPGSLICSACAAVKQLGNLQSKKTFVYHWLLAIMSRRRCGVIPLSQLINTIRVTSFIFPILVISLIVLVIARPIPLRRFLTIFVISHPATTAARSPGFHETWERAVEDLLACCRGSRKEGGWKVERNPNRGLLQQHFVHRVDGIIHPP